MQGSPEQQETWVKNRAVAYKGSMLQFMRSLYSRTLQEDGFELQFIIKSNNEEYPITIKRSIWCIKLFKGRQYEHGRIFSKSK